MQPYYQDPFCTIYHGDCREILPSVRGDVVITDPVWPDCPDGLMCGSNGNQDELLRDALSLCKAARTWVVVLGFASDPRWLSFAVPDIKPFIRTQSLPYSVPGYRGRLLGGDEVAYVFGEIPPGNGLIPGRVTAESVPKSKRAIDHPCPRSITHMKALVRWWSIETDVVVDPFCGAGTLLLATKTAGRRSIGIEIEERYCEIAANSLQQECFRFAELNPTREPAEEQALLIPS